MIIYGYATEPVPLYSGDFHCPSCERSRPFVREAVRKHFTLFFIKLFPFGDALGEYIRCHGCDGMFAPELENYDPNARLMEVLQQHRRLIALALVHAERTGPAARAALAKALESIAPLPITAEEIDRDIRFAERNKAPLRRIVARQSGPFDLSQKVFFLKTLASCLSADEAADRKAAHVLEVVSNAMGVPVIDDESAE